ncbi:hypothetical protein [Daejeonella oryzae]|uniref:hypothetical protein n=1 Tax=Daejeonella oryzae TaxID=1122943 RepID=UPI0003F60A03|nr:hypothetical protein [Daejeonella oryzae]
MKYILTVFLLVTSLVSINAQHLEGNISLHAFADNREYANSNRFSQTIFGARFSPEIGLLIDSVHRIRVGFNALHEFGSPKFAAKIDPVIYYQYQKDKWDFYIGSFPRQNLLTDYPRVIFKDTLTYYRPNIEGMLAKFQTRHGNEKVWIDWTSRQTDLDRETFLFGISGKYQTGIFFTEHYAMMFHNAGPGIDIPGDHIQDNGAAAIKLGIDLSDKTLLDSLTFNIGGVMSFERTRNVSDWQTPKGYLLEMHAAYKRFAFSNSFYQGNGHQLIYGDQFYTAKTYNRSDFFYTPIKYKNIEGQFIFSFHFLEGEVDNQQAFSLRYNLSGSKNLKRQSNY